MTGFKLAFKIHRYPYDSTDGMLDREPLRLELQDLLDEKHIPKLRIYAPTRNSIKVLFYNEDDLNKVLICKDFFEDKGFYPKLPISLKASRTIFCSGFDPVLLQTYSKEHIVDYLESNGWLITDIYILKSKTSFKLEFPSTALANSFLNDSNTEVGGIKILPEHKETEVDRTIQQCWECGLINTDHSSQNCPEQHKCLKCGKTEQI